MAEARATLNRLRARGRHLVGRHPRKMPSRRTPLRRVARAYNFGRDRQCPICSSQLRSFAPFGFPSRPEALCPVCGSLEWHRLGWMEAERVMLERQGRTRVLQVAPEPEIEDRFRSMVGTDYVSVDLAFGRAGLSASIEELPFGPGSFDVLYCSHVLEHVTDDESAMRELRRVTADDGVAIILVPITAEQTWGDPSIEDEDERTRLFGQHDHVRVFGMDVVERLEGAGWSVSVVSVDGLPDELVRRFGLPHHEVTRPAGDVFVCRPRPTGEAAGG